MTRQLFYGFGGLKKSGKDTAAEILRDSHHFTVASVSAPIDAAAREINPVITIDYARNGRLIRYTEYVDRVCGGDFTKAKENHFVRDFLRQLGDFARSVDEEVWTKRIRESIQEEIQNGRGYALTGIRFPKEIELVRELGGTLIWITRPGVEDTTDTHSTETSVGPDDFDIVIENTGTIAELQHIVRLLHTQVSAH